MNQLFLGKWWHWLILLATIVIFCLAGQAKMHVIYFNLFASVLVVTTLVGLIMIVRYTSPGEQVTRDPLEDDV